MKRGIGHIARMAFVAVVLAAGAAVWAAPGKEYVKKGVVGEGELNGISYVACDSKDRVVTLLSTGTVIIYDKDGKQVQKFDSGLADAVVVAIGPKDCICVIAQKAAPAADPKDKKKVEPAGAVCWVFDSEGKKVKELLFKEVSKVASGVYSKGRLLLADLGTSQVMAFDAEKGNKLTEMGKGIRTCCSIFGITAKPNGNILISNLGGFQVQEADAKGKTVDTFGKRGEDKDCFHGCCNPVNCGCLPDGRLMTVEKDTTRIKIYDSTGKTCEQVLTDVEELVKGCAYVPMAVDSVGNVYLANRSKGYLVKCGPKSE
jgi:hypothetical protein